MKKITVLSLFLSFNLFQLMAQNPKDTKSTFSLKTIENLPSNFFLTQLDNGLEVLVIEDATVPLATIELVVKNGAFVQTDDLNGLAHLYEHMFFKANRDYPSQEVYLDRIKELGIVFNGTTSDERVNYFFTLNKSKLTEGLQFMNAAARYPLFLSEEMKKENVVVAGEFQRNESNPTFYLFKDMDKRLWGKLMSRKNSIGDYQVILNATPQIMKNIQNRYYYPNNSMLVIAGDVKHDNVFSQVSNLYGDWKPSDFSIWEKYPIPEFETLKQSISFITQNDNVRVPIYMMCLHGPDTRGDLAATYPADVFSGILAEKNSLLQKALVETGLAYQVNVSYQTQKYTGPIRIILVPNPQKTKEAIATLKAEIAKWDKDDYFTDEQMQSSKDQLEIDDIYGKESTSSYIHTVTYWWAVSSLEYYSNYNKNIQAVTRQDIKDYLHKYVMGKPAAEGIIVSPQLRASTNLDEYYFETDTITNYVLKFTDPKLATNLDDENTKVMKSIAFCASLNAGKMIGISVNAKKAKDVTARYNFIVSELKKVGVPAENIFNLGPEPDTTPMNSATFIFKNK